MNWLNYRHLKLNFLHLFWASGLLFLCLWMDTNASEPKIEMLEPERLFEISDFVGIITIGSGKVINKGFELNAKIELSIKGTKAKPIRLNSQYIIYENPTTIGGSYLIFAKHIKDNFFTIENSQNAVIRIKKFDLVDFSDVTEFAGEKGQNYARVFKANDHVWLAICAIENSQSICSHLMQAAALALNKPI